MSKLYLSGNEAIAYGLIHAGVRFITGYPGTPSSEIIPTAQKIIKDQEIKAYVDWAINEKVAYEVAYGACLANIKSAVTMKQVGLNVAMDPFMNSAYVGTVAGFVVISVDDPGPHSSQTEQDSRFMAMTAKIPILDPSTVEEAFEFSKKAIQLSEKYGIPVMLRSTTRISHGRALVEVDDQIIKQELNPYFKTSKEWTKQLSRFAATPKQRLELHKILNRKIGEITKENIPRLFFNGNILILSSGAVFSYLYELIEEHSLQDKVTLAKFDMPYPLSRDTLMSLTLPQNTTLSVIPRDSMSREISQNKEKILNINKTFSRIVSIEETYPVIELQLNTEGRRNGIVPKEGELLPEVCEEILENLKLIKKRKIFTIPPLKRPSLCPGCGHRIALYEVKKVFGKKAIYAGDIGCYTLALNFNVTDIVLNMGASVSLGFAFSKTFELGNKNQDIVSIIGDSTFFHTGIPPLIDAVHYQVPFLLIILDNQTVAMTGNQKTLSTSKNFLGECLKPIVIEDIVRSIGINFLEVTDPYDYEKSLTIIKEAKKFLKERKEPAVVIFRHLCINTQEGLKSNPKKSVKISEELCKGCKFCINEFECPAIVFDEGTSKAMIDKTLCISCGCCIYICPTKAINLI
ncbi:MAG: thiamine pyrophosphate-dependent enzyme [Thermodesulfovibrio sp.]|uniref:thiamine pyrophosphate-dependent enzyme n=1 Tax=unclassified Thermodesulfovibrio TaxID=2645936 RepID=UPI00083A5738|nr:MULTISPECIES: thiamine pyrophosphate-dependent enzyme [unclassified Thermodesulfovibrio]MDI1471888.1 thiamine pyrophosphate-dependent enzyme [Thermodesulfovibrio sp. 1176]MDI6714959.1 thiamine pyrophosphate-dependent enzyme [Thermodesulfovibrio sp.]ODA44786.1 Indolepyruvate oxidoreductase subunit IorA [Thermodesulfovibrio sp. N1]